MMAELSVTSQQLAKSLIFYKEDPCTFALAAALSRDYTHLARCYTNLALFKVICRYTYSLSADNLGAGVTLYFGDIKLFVNVPTVGVFYSLCDELNEIPPVDVYQAVHIGSPQKFVVGYTDADIVTRHLQICFDQPAYTCGGTRTQQATSEQLINDGGLSYEDAYSCLKCNESVYIPYDLKDKYRLYSVSEISWNGLLYESKLSVLKTSLN
jgi:hypothetical protein